MQQKVIKQWVLVAIAAILIAVLLPSCNRGYGCPNNFSIQSTSITE